MKKFDINEFKKEIKKEFGSITKFKKHLKDISKNEYGCYYSEIEIYGCKIVYTSNPNCWASYIVKIQHIGFSSELALGKTSITSAGKQRGCFKDSFILKV